MVTRRRDVRNEEDHFPQDLADVVRLIEAVERLGYRGDEARGLSAWAAQKAVGRPDTTSSRTRAKYRRILAELALATGPLPRDSGFIRPAVALAVAGAGLALVVAVHLAPDIVTPLLAHNAHGDESARREERLAA